MMMFNFPFINFPYRNYTNQNNYYKNAHTYNSQAPIVSNRFSRNYYGNYPFNDYVSNNNNNNNSTLKTDSYKNNENETKTEKNSSNSNESEEFIFNLFGIKLYFDDLIIIALLFFLYSEEVKDNELFISLILLLIS